MRISEQHAARYQEYYAAHPVVKLPSRWCDRVEELARRVQAQTILDYGCGPLRGLSGFLPRTVYDYDPGVAGLDAEPEPADLVCCVHTLEHLEPGTLDDVLKHLRSLTLKALFIVVSCEKSTKWLLDGTPWHTLVRDAHWWELYLLGWGFVEQPPMKTRPGAEYAALWEV